MKSHAATTTYNIAIMGNSSVGKSCLFGRIEHAVREQKRAPGSTAPPPFTLVHSPTIGQDIIIFTHRFPIRQDAVKEEDYRVIHMRLWDTAGQERFKTITKSALRGKDGVIFAFDINDMPSLYALRAWNDQLHSAMGTYSADSGLMDDAENDPVRMLVATKMDMLDASSIEDGTYLNEIQEPIIAIQRICCANDDKDVREVQWTSAQSGSGVVEALEALVQHIYAHKHHTTSEVKSHTKKGSHTLVSPPTHQNTVRLTQQRRKAEGCC